MNVNTIVDNVKREDKHFILDEEYAVIPVIPGIVEKYFFRNNVIIAILVTDRKTKLFGRQYVGIQIVSTRFPEKDNCKYVQDFLYCGTSIILQNTGNIKPMGSSGHLITELETRKRDSFKKNMQVELGGKQLDKGRFRRDINTAIEKITKLGYSEEGQLTFAG